MFVINLPLILLRLLTYKDNIEVDYNQENNNLSKRISDKASEYLRNQLISLKKNGARKIDTKWLNLCIKNLTNSSLYNKRIRNIYDNILYQIQNIPKFDENILNIIEDNIIIFSKHIIDMYFNGQLEGIFNIILTEDDDLIKIINDPKDFYTMKIKEKYDEIIEKLIESQEFIKLINFIREKGL